MGNDRKIDLIEDMDFAEKELPRYPNFLEECLDRQRIFYTSNASMTIWYQSPTYDIMSVSSFRPQHFTIESQRG